MSTKIKTPKTKASDMFFLAAVTFVLLLVQPILNSLLNAYGFAWAIALRAIYIVIWAFGVKGIINVAKKDCGFDILKKEDAPSALQWMITGVFAAAVVAYFVWNQFHLLTINITGLTSVKNIVAFISLLLMNASKATVLTLLIALVQKGTSLLGKAGKYVPFGGIAVGIIWAVMYILSSAEIWSSGIGFNWTYPLYQFAYGLILGIFFVLIGNKTKYAFPFIAVTSLFIFMA